ncbi:MAG: glycosyltransferase family 9 protein [Candidatus Omnitrophica bacterium]|nr:glycosyltransferase family 9 protein [Candidatus Omnitrophota bacterium]
MVKKFLIIMSDRMGDMLMTTPVLRKLRKSYPGCRVDLLTSWRRKQIIEGNKYIDRVYIYQKFSDALLEKRWITALKAFWIRQNYTACLVFSASEEQHRLAFEAGGKKCLKTGFAFSNTPWLDKTVLPDRSVHDIVNKLSLLREALGLKISARDYDMDFVIARGAAIRIKKYLKSQGISSGGKYFVIHPGCSSDFPFRRWSTKGYIEIAQFLRKQGFKVFVTGQGEEWVYANQIMLGGQPGAQLFVDRPIHELAALIKGARGLLCADTGILHLSRALKTPVVSLFGPTTSVETGCVGQGIYKMIQAKGDCPACFAVVKGEFTFKRVCTNLYPPAPCMASITPGQVKEAIQQILVARGSA